MVITMKNRIIKSISIIVSSVLLLLSLASCGEDAAAYRNDLDANAVNDKIEECVPLADGYYTADADYLGFYFEGADALIESYEIKIANVSTNINQFGVFKVKDGQAEAMSALCESYLELKMARWIVQAEYIASEHPKMEDSEVRVFGNYVVYTILTEEDKTTVFAAVKELLKQ